MNGLVSGYGSDSDEEESKNETSEQKSSSINDWMECMDNTTGYPYYWNRNTNEVRWDRPPGMPAPKNDKPKEHIVEKKQKSSKKSRSKSPPQVFIGPTLPQLTPEEIARQKVLKFEEAMAKDIEKEIFKEDPPDWKKIKPQKGLYSKPFAWRKSYTCIQTFKNLETTLKKASHSISLIAGVYGDDDGDDDCEKPSPPKKRTGVHVKVQKPASKQPKPLLKEIPGIFKEVDDDEDEVGDDEKDQIELDLPKKKRRWDMKDRTYINSAAERLCLKLEALDVSKVHISPLKLLAVQVETLFAAWQVGALSNTYLQSSLEKFTTQMSDIENHHLAPPGWRAVWDRSVKKYAYENLITREIQFEKPEDDEFGDEDEDDGIVIEASNEKEPSEETPPPLPPQPPKEIEPPPLPPPPPEASNSPIPKPTEPQNQVEDMELSDEESETTPIIETQNNGNNGNLSDALSSFYSDLAFMDPGSTSQESTPIPTPPQVDSPGPSIARESSPALSDDRSSSPSGETFDEKRKRKTKISSGLAMKKKNVGSLVAKWQNIQQEVKRNK